MIILNLFDFSEYSFHSYFILYSIGFSLSDKPNSTLDLPTLYFIMKVATLQGPLNWTEFICSNQSPSNP